MRYKKAVLKAILVFVLLLAPASTRTVLAEEDMTSGLMCPCECAMMVSTCDCPTAVQVKKEIAQMKDAGLLEKQIISALQAEYGNGILVYPEEKDPTPLWTAGIPLAFILVFLAYILSRKPDPGIIPDNGKYERQFEEEYRTFVSEMEEI